MAAAQGGDREALDALLRRHHDRIALICRRMCGNDADADDATQEALIALVRGLHHYDGRAAFTTWAYRVTTNACLDELRRRARRPFPGLEADGSDDGAVPALLAGRSGAVEDAVTARIDVEDALARLDPAFRAAVVLRDLCELDYAEIADVLGIPPGTVRSRISRGRTALAGLLLGNPDPLPGRPNKGP